MLKEIISNWYSKLQEKQREPGVIYVTDLTSCQAKSYDNIMPAVHGTLLHKAIEAVMSEFSGRKVETEVSLKRILRDGTLLEGRVDMIVDNNILVEIKTGKNLKREHVAQVLIYNWMREFRDIYLFYIYTDSMTEFKVDRYNVYDENGKVVMQHNIEITEDVILELVEKWKKGSNFHPFNSCVTCFYKLNCLYSTYIPSSRNTSLSST